MKAFQFAFVVDGVDLEDDELLVAIYDAFNEVGVSCTAGRTTVEFVVEGDPTWEAMSQTTEVLEGLRPEVRVVRLDRDLVTIPEIASRAEVTPEAVRLLIAGARGPGGFPVPLTVLSGGSRVWEWAPVLDWLQGYGKCIDEPVGVDHVCAAIFDATIAARGLPVQVVG